MASFFSMERMILLNDSMVLWNFLGGRGIEVRSSHFVEFWIIVFPILIERQSNYIKLKIY